MEGINHHYLVIDVEATCWTNPEERKVQNEIIEIGIAILAPDITLLCNEGWFIRPKLSPILSDFCTQLTSISQRDIDQAAEFSVVMATVARKVLEVTGKDIQDSLFVSWGDYDRKQFLRDCTLHGYPYPFGDHFNLKEAFRRTYNVRNAGLDTALQFLNIPLEGIHHRGKDDALNISKILRVMRPYLTQKPTY